MFILFRVIIIITHLRGSPRCSVPCLLYCVLIKKQNKNKPSPKDGSGEHFYDNLLLEIYILGLLLIF